MQSTKNYGLAKQELVDKPDITQIAPNWDVIDAEMKRLSDEKFDKTGGTVSGDVTVVGNVKMLDPTEAEHGATKRYVDKRFDLEDLSLQNKTVSRGTAPSTVQTFGMTLFDKDGTVAKTDRLANLTYQLNTDNTVTFNLMVSDPSDGINEKQAGIRVQWINGVPRINLTNHPSVDSNDHAIATTNWIRSLKATPTTYGIVRAATDEDAIKYDVCDAAITPQVFHDVGDFRKPSTTYAVGDKVECAFNFELFLECTKAGTTSAEPLNTRGVVHDQQITDGSVVWTVRTHVRSINGNVPDDVGDIRVSAVLTLRTWED